MIDAREVSRLVSEHDGLTYLIDQMRSGERLNIHYLSANGASGINSETRQRIERLMRNAFLQVTIDEYERVRGEMTALGVSIE